jgi:hypothetical protein
MFAVKMGPMKIVSSESIEKAIEIIDQWNDDEFAAFASEFTSAQPSLCAYIFIHEEDFSDDDFDMLANLALMIYKAFQIECGTARMLTEQEIEDAALRQMDYLESIEDANEEEIADLVDKAFDSTKQPVLLEFAAHELHDAESAGEIEHESGGALLYPILQMVVDMLDIAFNGANLRVV